MNCDWHGCTATAAWTIRLRFWARGQPRDSEPCRSGPVVSVCEKHKAPSLRQNWYGPEQREELRRQMSAAGYAPPDFGTADVYAQAIES